MELSSGLSTSFVDSRCRIDSAAVRGGVENAEAVAEAEAEVEMEAEVNEEAEAVCTDVDKGPVVARFSDVCPSESLVWQKNHHSKLFITI